MRRPNPASFNLSDRLAALHEAEARALDRMEEKHLGRPTRKPKKTVDPHRRQIMSDEARKDATTEVQKRGTSREVVAEIMERGVKRNAMLGQGRPPIEGFGKRGEDGLCDAMKGKRDRDE